MLLVPGSSSSSIVEVVAAVLCAQLLAAVDEGRNSPFITPLPVLFLLFIKIVSKYTSSAFK
jgi:hypothetical protein